MKTTKLLLGILFTGFLFIQAGYAGLEPSTVEAFKKVNIAGVGTVYQVATMDGNIYVGAQPAESALPALKKLQIKTLINLRQKSEMTFDEQAAVTKLGMSYINIPIDVNKLGMDEIKQFNQAVYEPKNYPIFIHCESGNRVAMMLAINNIMESKTPVDAAINEAKNYGLTKPELMEVIRATAKRYNLGK